MRIISGKYKGKILCFPKDSKIRATQDRVREAIFNIIGPQIIGASVLDLCSGSGSIGIEALSRGASKVVFVEKHIKVLEKNIRLIDEKPDVYAIDVRKYIKNNNESFDIIFFDPPWDDALLYEVTLKGIYDFGILNPLGMVICEHYKKYDLPHLIPSGSMQTYVYGDTKVTFIKL